MTRFSIISTIIVILFLNACNSTPEVEGRNLISSSLTITTNKLIYTTWKKEIIIEDLFTGKILYRHAILDICYAKPILKHNNLYFPLSDNKLICLNVQTNKLIWERELSGRCNSLYVSNNIIIADIKHYGIGGYHENDGTTAYEILYHYGEQCTLPDLSPYRTSLDSRSFYLNNWQCKTASSFNSTSGKINWTLDLGDGQSNSAFVLNTLFLGINRNYQSGDIYLIDSKKGNILFKKASLFEQNFNPIIYKNKVYYYTYDSSIHCFNVLSKADSVFFRFSESQDVSGSQMFLLKDNLYYSKGESIYSLNLNNSVLKVVGHSERALCGVALGRKGILFIY